MKIPFKARSSSPRKELFKKIQVGKGVSSPVQLLLDMKIRWGSTYVMLNRVEINREVRILFYFTSKIDSKLYHSKNVDDFVLELGKLEKNSAKRKKILALELNDDEWKRVGLFCDLLSVSYFLYALYEFMIIVTSFSMPTLLNKHSQLIDIPLSTTPFLRLKLCMQHGLSDLLNKSTLLFRVR
jgi:hypothetical protein